ncbi:hypothetical protein JHK87_010661 [Glycine soja]|nr:hypothetical protein JHK87_010661 [Glycine soja]
MRKRRYGQVRKTKILWPFEKFRGAGRKQEAQRQQPIKTVVVLVMENRSFDHMLGWMKESINTLINGVTGDECNPVSTKSPRKDSICFTDDAEFVDPDPGHSFEDVCNRYSVPVPVRSLP